MKSRCEMDETERAHRDWWQIWRRLLRTELATRFFEASRQLAGGSTRPSYGGRECSCELRV